MSVQWAKRGAKTSSDMCWNAWSRGSVLPKQRSKYGSSDSPRTKSFPVHLFLAEFNAADRVWCFSRRWRAYSKEDSGKKCSGSDIPFQKRLRRPFRISVEFETGANSQEASLHKRKLLTDRFPLTKTQSITWLTHVFNIYLGFAFIYRIWISPCS